MKVEYNDDNFEIVELDQSISQPESMMINLKNVVATTKIRFSFIEYNKSDLEHMMLMNIFGT